MPDKDHNSTPPGDGRTLAESPPALGKLGALWTTARLRRTMYFLGVALLAFNLLEFPRHATNVWHDPSSVASYEYYAARHFQFGKELYQNVGPYGYVHYGWIYGGYLPVQKILLKNLSRLGFLLLVLWASRRLPHPGLKFGWWTMFFLFQPFSPLFDWTSLLSFPEMDWDQDYAYLTIYLAALYLMQDRKDRLFYGAAGALLCLVAFTALSKNTSFVLAGAAVGAVAFHKLLRKDFRAGFSCPLLFLFCLVALWVLAGQQPSNLPGFVRGIFAFSGGYTEAMPPNATLRPALAGGLIAGLLVLRSVYNWLALKQGIARTMLEAFVLFIAWKHGFVAMGFPHSALFFVAALFLSLPLFFVLLPVTAERAPRSVNTPCAPEPSKDAFHRVPDFARDEWDAVERVLTIPEDNGRVPVSPPSPRLRRLADLLWPVLAAANVLSLVGACVSSPGFGYYPAFLWFRLKDNLAWVVSPPRKLAEMERRLHEVQRMYSLPGIKATVGDVRVDFFGDEPGWPLLNGLNYRSRPMPILFAAWNETLECANETFYRDPQTAPEYVICALHPTNNRFVPQDDALALRALLDNYHPVLREQAFLLLARNPPPLRDRAEKKLLSELSSRFLTPIPLNTQTNERVWLEAEFQPTWLGRLRAFFYRPAACYISYRFAGEPTEYYSRFITGLGRSGCMVSPFISDNRGLLQFYRPGDELSDLRRIEVFGFSCDPGDEKYFKQDIRIRFYSIPGPTRRAALPQAAQP